MAQNKLIYESLDMSLDWRKAEKILEHMTSPDLPREMARAWLSSLSLDEFKQELAWIKKQIKEKEAK